MSEGKSVSAGMIAATTEEASAKPKKKSMAMGVTT